jgi:hypothetical protein
VKQYLDALEVAELAELLEDLPVRTDLVDRVLQTAKEGRGMTLILRDNIDEAGPRSASFY